MRAFLILSALCAALGDAKPQYNYPAPQRPSGSYGAPGGSIGGGSFGGGSSSSGAFASAGTGLSESSFSSGSSGLGGGGIVGGGGGGGGSFATSGGTLVQKHIYVHVAPPEPEEIRPQRPIGGGQSTKHYKIIFIKAPTYQPTQQQILQAQAQNEEKTLVYVLVKKPDDVADITLPTAAPTAPSKPEVYFIRYKAKSEAVGGGGGAAAGSQLSGTGAGLGGGSGGGFGTSLSLASSSAASSSQFNLNTGDSSSSVSVGRPATSYGPPGQSGPY